MNVLKSLNPFGKPSEQAKTFDAVLKSDEVGLAFLKSVLFNLQSLVYKNRQSQIPKDDINFITEYVISDIQRNSDTNKFLKRVDGYLHAYGQLYHYSQAYKVCQSSLEKLKEMFFSHLIKIFDETRGQQPDLIVNDKQLILQMNLEQFLTHSAIIDSIGALKKFLIICKFVLQVDARMNDGGRTRQWTDIMLNVKRIDISLTEFIDTYLIYEEGFKQFPFDMPLLAHLIRQLHPPQTQKSSLDTFILLKTRLQIKNVAFLEQFIPIFGEGVHDKKHAMEHIERFFVKIRLYNKYFPLYLSAYANNALVDDLWKMFLRLYEILEIKEIVQHNLKKMISEKLPSVSFRTFHQYMKLAKTSLENIPEQSTKHFMDAFKNIFDNYIEEKAEDSYQWNRFNSADCIDLFEIGMKLSQDSQLERNSLLLLVRKIVFNVDSASKNSVQKLIDMFKNLSMIDDTWCHQCSAEKIIQDDWLSDFLIPHIDIWLKINREAYNNLSTNYQSHPWSGHIWSRICHLSFSKMTGNKSSDILSKINQWIQAVQHHIYKPADIFTIIFMTKVFDLILEKCSKSVLLLPDISAIIKYIIAMKQNSSITIYQNRIEAFLTNTIGDVEQLIQLNRKFI